MPGSSARQEVARIEYWPGSGPWPYRYNFVLLAANGFNIIATRCAMFDGLLQQPSDSDFEVVYHICNSIQSFIRPFYLDTRGISWSPMCGPNTDFVMRKSVTDGLASALERDLCSFHRRHSSRLMFLDTAKIFITKWKSASLFEDIPCQECVGMSYHSLVYFKFQYSRNHSTQDLHIAMETTGPQIFEFHITRSLAALREMIECKYRCARIDITRSVDKQFWSDFEQFVEVPGPTYCVDDANSTTLLCSGGGPDRMGNPRKNMYVIPI